MVFLWPVCGEMRGKDGPLMVTFSLPKIRQLFELYFAD
jgi:hypothetical protein